jgi:hypothetical protein
MEHLKQQRWYQVMVYSFNSSFHREFSSVRFYSISECNADRDGLHRTVKTGLYAEKTGCTLSKIDSAALHTRGREIKER